MNDPIYEDENGVLKNLVGAKTYEELEAKESDLTALRIKELSMKPIRGSFDLKHLQSIHKQIFQDIYSWAGQVRQVDISKGFTPFAHTSRIEPEFKRVARELQGEGCLKGLKPQEFASRAAYFMGEVNIIHPFREGNGRSQRAFFSQLAKEAGYHIQWENMSKEEMTKASIAASVYVDPKPLAALIEKSLQILQPQKALKTLFTPEEKASLKEAHEQDKALGKSQEIEK